MVHIKRLGLEDHRRATAAHGTSDFNPDMAWDYVWGRATEDFAWWRQEFEESGLLIKTLQDRLSHGRWGRRHSPSLLT